MNEIWTLAVAMIVPVGTLIYTSYGLKNKAETDYVQRLETRLAACEKSRDEFIEKITKQAEEIANLQRILSLLGVVSKEPKS